MRTKYLCVLLHIRTKEEVTTVNIFKPPVIVLLTVPRWCFISGTLLLLMFRVCLCYAVLSVSCSLVVTCWDRADLFALLCSVCCVFVT